MKQFQQLERGFPYPYGVTRHSRGYNFAIFSEHATSLSLCFFKKGKELPAIEIPLDPEINKTGHIWHIFIKKADLKNYEYGYRLSGPYSTKEGYYYDSRSVLLDPYAKQIASPTAWGNRTKNFKIHKGTITAEPLFDWEDDHPPQIPKEEMVIYEMHVRGFTNDPSSGVSHRGTFLGMIEKIPYLKSLGINAVELLPIYEFDECEISFINPATGTPLYNYWGYSPINFFSPMNRYGSGQSSVITEFKTLVKALHANGIEVILDVVYNHTAEGNHSGPILSYKGIENLIYYMVRPDGEYYNFSGCGNTLNCNHPIVIEMIRDSLRYWVMEMHVDGFRFDLASIFFRSQNGMPLSDSPVIEALSLDPLLASTKFIAEAWDAAGLYQVGSFSAYDRWSEWNGKYRDDVRTFLKGSDGFAGLFATRISGSQDLYGNGKLPTNSINFITSHDGFTLNDLVSYNEKHNETNGEENRDGHNHNLSWNCGIEGATDEIKILKIREIQRKNFHVALMVSRGIPMLLMGDEYGHTKLGNNNTWCHDNRLNWFQWDTLEENAGFFRFYQKMIAFRKSHPVLRCPSFPGPEDVIWHGLEPEKANWSAENRFIAFSLPDIENQYTLYIAFNVFFNTITAELPKTSMPWYRVVDTSLPSPEDIVDFEAAPKIDDKTVTLAPYSALILKSQKRLL